MGICACIEIAALLFILKKQNLYFQVTINFQKSFLSKHYPSNPPFLSAFRVRMKLICVFNFKEEKKSVPLAWKFQAWVFSSLLSFPLPLLSQLHKGGPQCWGAKGIMLICFFPLLLVVQQKKHLFPQTLIIHKDHFQRDIRRGWVGGIQKRTCCVFVCLFFYRYYLLTFYSRTATGDRQNSFHPVISYSWKTMNSSSACLSRSGRERWHRLSLKLGALPYTRGGLS